MSENRDYYEVLGVDRDADARTIKRAFLKKARTVHPDVSDDPEAEAKFKELNEAYSVLSDEQKRANYDRYGTADGPGGSGYVDINDIFGGMGMDDLFSSFFGGGAGGGARSRRERRRGRDMAISLSVTLEEAALGCKKTISYDRLAPCEDCNGTGRAEGAQEKQCGRCHGTGYVTTVQRSFLGQVQSSSPCPDCHGEGTVIEAKGTAYGVVTSKIGSGWTHWGELKGVDYAEKGEQIAMSETKLAVVTTASGSLNMRKTASKSAEVIAKIPRGATVTVLMEADDWWRVQYKNSTGWCAAEFLTKQENADNQAWRNIQIVDSAGNVFEPVGDFTVKVASADVGDS